MTNSDKRDSFCSNEVTGDITILPSTYFAPSYKGDWGCSLPVMRYWKKWSRGSVSAAVLDNKTVLGKPRLCANLPSRTCKIICSLDSYTYKLGLASVVRVASIVPYSIAGGANQRTGVAQFPLSCLINSNTRERLFYAGLDAFPTKDLFPNHPAIIPRLTRWYVDTMLSWQALL